MNVSTSTSAWGFGGVLIGSTLIVFGTINLLGVALIPRDPAIALIGIGIVILLIRMPLIGLKRHISVTSSSIWFRETRGSKERWIAEYRIEPGTVVVGGNKRAKWDLYFLGPDSTFLDCLSLWELGFTDKQITSIARAVPGYTEDEGELGAAMAVWIGDERGPKRFDLFKKRTRNTWP